VQLSLRNVGVEQNTVYEETECRKRQFPHRPFGCPDKNDKCFQESIWLLNVLDHWHKTYEDGDFIE
jgi:hypothetical protein